MSNPIIGGLDAATGIVVEREMTDDEYAAYLEQQENAQPLPGTSNE